MREATRRGRRPLRGGARGEKVGAGRCEGDEEGRRAAGLRMRGEVRASRTVVDEAITRCGTEENSIDVSRGGREVGAAALEAILRREAHVEGERGLVLVHLEPPAARTRARRVVPHDEEVARPRVGLLVEGRVEVRVVAQRAAGFRGRPCGSGPATPWTDSGPARPAWAS